tara:strand:+ start:11661 stop:12749 length:1089 start_codon:yes stop_codon:yes gene_type:complete
MSCNIKLISSIKEIEEIRLDWLSLEKKYPNKEYNFNIIYNWLLLFLNKDDERFGFNKKINILVLYDSALIQTIFPLIKVKRKYKRFIKYRSLEYIGQQYGGFSFDFIGNKTQKYISCILDWMKDNINYNLLNLSYQKEYQFKQFNNSVFFCISAYPIIDINRFSNYDSYNKEVYNSKIRYNIKSRKKKFELDGGEIIKTNYENISKNDFEGILKVSSTKEDEDKKDHYADKDKLKFEKKLLTIIDNQIIIAKIEQKIVGYQISYIFDKNRVFNGLSYHRKYKKYGIGNLIDDYEVQSEQFNDIHTISMGSGLDSYKLNFNTSFEKIYNIISVNETFFSKLISCFLFKKLKKINKETLEKLSK